MNRLLLGLILICCRVWAIETNDYSEYMSRHGKLKDFLENFKSTMKTGDEYRDIPILEPIFVEHLPIEITEKPLHLHTVFTDLYVERLSEYNVTRADFTMLGLKLRVYLSWPLLHVSGNYATTGKLNYFDIYGNGEIRASVYNLALRMEARLALSGLHLKAKRVKTYLSLKKLEFEITGLFGNSEMSESVGVAISENARQLLNCYHNTITKDLNLRVKEELNEYLADKTLLDFLKLISG